MVNATRLDDVSIVLLLGPCYMTDTEIYTKNIKTGVISYVPVKDITSDKYQVYSKKLDKFIPIRSVAVTNSSNRMIFIEKNAISNNVPSKDLYITPGHVMIYCGKEVKARCYPHNKRIKIEPTKIYNITTDERTTIMASNIEVVADNHDYFTSRYGPEGNFWTEN